MTREDLIRHCLTLPGAYEDYPFDNAWTAMRHSGNRKSFAFITTREDRLIINLKCEPMRADLLRSTFEGVTPGFHMNKVHWNTVTLGLDVPHSELFDMIRHSYELTRPGPKPAKARPGAKK